MIHGSSRRLLQSIAASFGVRGYRNRFLRSIMNGDYAAKQIIILKNYVSINDQPSLLDDYLQHFLYFLPLPHGHFWLGLYFLRLLIFGCSLHSDR